MKQWLRFLFSKIFLKTVGASLLFVIVVIVGVLIWMNRATHHGEVVVVPDVRLMELDEASKLIDSLGLHFEVIDSLHYVPGVQEGAVVEIFPAPFSEVKKGRTLMLSTNPSRLPKYPVPNFKDQLASYVIGKFKQKGFIIDSLVMVPDLSHDLVLKVVDSRGRSVEEQALYPTGSRFRLHVSGGQNGQTAFIPNLLGITLLQAKSQLMTYNLNTGALRFDGEIIDSNGAFVYRQYPVFEMDATLPAGSSVDLWLTTDSAKLNALRSNPLDTNTF